MPPLRRLLSHPPPPHIYKRGREYANIPRVAHPSRCVREICSADIGSLAIIYRWYFTSAVFVIAPRKKVQVQRIVLWQATNYDSLAAPPTTTIPPYPSVSFSERYTASRCKSNYIMNSPSPIYIVRASESGNCCTFLHCCYNAMPYAAFEQRFKKKEKGV
jgi:hypothetical protein